MSYFTSSSSVKRKCCVCLHELMKDYIFIQNSRQFSGKWDLNLLDHFSPVSFHSHCKTRNFFSNFCFVKLCFALPVLVITEFISKSMAVLLNVMFMCVGIQCYDKYVCVCGVGIVGCVLQ